MISRRIQAAGHVSGRKHYGPFGKCEDRPDSPLTRPRAGGPGSGTSAGRSPVTWTSAGPVPRVACLLVTDSSAVVVAGAGLAGFRTVQELRARGLTGQITLVGAEPRPPYDRPPLSKKVLTESALDPSLNADFAALEVDFRPDEPAVRLAGTTLVTSRAEYPFDHLVLATGAVPIGLPGPGRQRFLRSYDDALALRDLLRPGLRLAIIGAGWIGAELATAAAGLGAQVTVVEAGPAPLAGAVGAPIGAQTVRWYAEAGVELRTGAAVQSVEPGGLALADGGWIPADEIVTAVGVRPATGWLAGSDIRLENGVAVDAGLRASRPGVYAVGDCAAFESGRFGRRLRFEHWDVALHAPEVVAANVLGGDEAYDPVPYFWSEQFGRMVQYAGYHGDADQFVWRGDPASPSWAACWLTEGRLAAMLTVNSPRDLLQARRHITSQALIDITRLTDPAIPLKSAATS
jgi:3-phenylpropionate/trans-cinnamate dioxygenase ferredoxin reductase subunit